MLREAELFVMAEQMLLEVLGRIRAEHLDIVVPPLSDQPGDDQPMSLPAAVTRHAHDDARVPGLLRGATRPEEHEEHEEHRAPDADLLGDDPAKSLALLAGAACAAARAATDGDAVVHAGTGDIPTRELLWRLTIARCFLAHEVAMQLGSRACPLPEDLARGMWEGTQADAPAWRSRGVFREPIPTPADASWRDRFLASAGRDPHPFLD